MSEPLAAWSPALPVFIRRSVIVGVITLFVLAAAGWAIGVATGSWMVLYVAPVLALVYNMGFEDPSRWRIARQNRWYLRTDAIIHNGPEGEARIPLADIKDVRTRLGWSVVLFLKTGLRVRIAYVENASDIAAQILAARERLVP
jgi:hypothetical protein